MASRGRAPADAKRFAKPSNFARKSRNLMARARPYDATLRANANERSGGVESLSSVVKGRARVAATFRKAVVATLLTPPWIGCAPEGPTQHAEVLPSRTPCLRAIHFGSVVMVRTAWISVRAESCGYSVTRSRRSEVRAAVANSYMVRNSVAIRTVAIRRRLSCASSIALRLRVARTARLLDSPREHALAGNVARQRSTRPHSPQTPQ